jgi:hypothetical protein
MILGKTGLDFEISGSRSSLLVNWEDRQFVHLTLNVISVGVPMSCHVMSEGRWGSYIRSVSLQRVCSYRIQEQFCQTHAAVWNSNSRIVNICNISENVWDWFCIIEKVNPNGRASCILEIIASVLGRTCTALWASWFSQPLQAIADVIIKIMSELLSSEFFLILLLAIRITQIL